MISTGNYSWATWFKRCKSVVLMCAVTLTSARDSSASGHSSSAPPAEHETSAADDANSRGIKLGEYQIRSYYPVKAQKSIVQFALYATAKDEQLDEIRHVAAERKHKIRDQVITVARLVPLAYFNEPDLESFRRRILLRLRRALPELIIDEVYISDFQLKVQSM